MSNCNDDAEIGLLTKIGHFSNSLLDRIALAWFLQRTFKKAQLLDRKIIKSFISPTHNLYQDLSGVINLACKPHLMQINTHVHLWLRIDMLIMSASSILIDIIQTQRSLTARLAVLYACPPIGVFGFRIDFQVQNENRIIL